MSVMIQITYAEGEPHAWLYQRRRYRSLLSQSFPSGIAPVHIVQPAADRQRKVEGSVTFMGSWPR